VHIASNSSRPNLACTITPFAFVVELTSHTSSQQRSPALHPCARNHPQAPTVVVNSVHLFAYTRSPYCYKKNSQPHCHSSCKQAQATGPHKPMLNACLPLSLPSLPSTLTSPPPRQDGPLCRLVHANPVQGFHHGVNHLVP
jgi:hypothetical protein